MLEREYVPREEKEQLERILLENLRRHAPEHPLGEGHLMKFSAQTKTQAVLRNAEKQLLDEVARRNASRRKLAGGPEVGIFWMYGGRILAAGEYISEAEDLGGFKNYSKTHEQYWTEMQRIGAVPREMEYDEAPRGRVVYTTATRTFTLYGDPCILQRKGMIGKVMQELHLPPETKVMRDEHYRCPNCLPDNFLDD